MENTTNKERNTNAASVNAYPMNGGDVPYSYAKNSAFYQQNGLDIAKAFLQDEISKKLDINDLLMTMRSSNSNSSSFKIADLGCSIGPNTFLIVQNIIQAVQLKCQSSNNNIEFQVFFSDHSCNDFNTLFKSLPSERNYFAVGVPGTFHGPLFPRDSLHFVHSSYAVHWLSRVPIGVDDKGSTAWNRGRILQGGSKETRKAYADQFANDMEGFLKARADELVSGGFMALLLPCIPNGANPSECALIAIYEVLCSCLMDLAKRGILDEGKVELFNLPEYFTCPAEIEGLVQRNGCFKIERLETLLRPMADITRENIAAFSMLMRASLQSVIEQHFGLDGGHIHIIDDLFSSYTRKLISSGLFSDSSYFPIFDLFVFLKRI